MVYKGNGVRSYNEELLVMEDRVISYRSQEVIVKIIAEDSNGVAKGTIDLNGSEKEVVLFPRDWDQEMIVAKTEEAYVEGTNRLARLASGQEEAPVTLLDHAQHFFQKAVRFITRSEDFSEQENDQPEGRDEEFERAEGQQSLIGRTKEGIEIKFWFKDVKGAEKKNTPFYITMAYPLFKD